MVKLEVKHSSNIVMVDDDIADHLRGFTLYELKKPINHPRIMIRLKTGIIPLSRYILNYDGIDIPINHVVYHLDQNTCNCLRVNLKIDTRANAKLYHEIDFSRRTKKEHNKLMADRLKNQTAK